MKFIIGKKINMTQIWKDDQVLAVTKVAVETCTITQIKDKDNDGYAAVQFGFGSKKEKNMKKPQIGHTKNIGKFACFKELRLENEEVANLKKGDKIDLDTFAVGDSVKISGISKGKGFQGVVKRYNFSGQITSHGTKDQVRMPGSIGAKGPAHVFKGTRMGGRMGGDNVSLANVEIADINKDENTILIKGGLPGARNSLVFIYAPGELKVTNGEAKEEDKNIEEVVTEAAEKTEVKTTEDSKEEKAPEAKDNQEIEEKSS